MESSRLFRLAEWQGGGEEARVPEPSGLGRARNMRRDRRLSVTVVESLDELNVVFALRTAGYLSNGAAWEETEIDDSDFGAIHLLAWHGRAPVGTMRIRIVSGIAILDRVVIKRSKFRSIIAREMVDVAVVLCRAQGVASVSGEEIVDGPGPYEVELSPAGAGGLVWEDELLRGAAHRMGALRALGNKAQGSKVSGVGGSSDAQTRE